MAPQELDKVLSIKFHAEVTKRKRDTNRLESLKIMQSATERYLKEKTLHSWASCRRGSFYWGVSQLKRNPSQNYTGCILKFHLQRQREVSASTTEEREVFHHWFRRRESDFDAWKITVFVLTSKLLVCLLCVNEFSSYDIICILNKMSKGFRFHYLWQTTQLGTIHQNLKFKAVKLCDFKMDLKKW